MGTRAMRMAAATIAIGAVLTGAGTAAAQSWVAPAPDPGAPASLVQQIQGSGVLDPTPAEWTPQGTLIADSGFNPLVDGFNFMNYSDHDDGFPNIANTVFFDVPLEDPVGLTADDMRGLFGNEACTNRVGPCVPTLVAEAARESYNNGMDGGHCFGIAGTASQIFDGDLPLPAIGSAFRPPYRTPWSSTMTRTIARNFAWQYANDAGQYSVSPTESVKVLRQGLKAGAAPYVLALWETPPATGGHAVTPTALYDRGNGLYDIAVWDNNYPGRVRAVHIDTTANGGKGSMQYLMFTSPGQPPTMASGDFSLVPAAKLLGRQPCPFCESAAGTTLTIDAVVVPSGGTVDVDVVGLDGKDIEGLEAFPAIDPPGDGMQTFPVVTVPAGVAFRVVLSTRGIADAVTTSVTAQTGDGTWIASNLAIRPKSRDVITFRPDRESIAFTSTTGTDPTLAVIDHAETGNEAADYLIEMRGIRLNARRTAELDLDFADERAILTTDQRATGRINVAATIESQTTEGTLYAWTEAPPTGHTLTVDFKPWTPTAVTALRGYLTNPAGETRDLTWRTRIASPQSAQTIGGNGGLFGEGSVI
ncbi:MAG: hypothetical protein ACKO2Y_11100 [Actinomycetota bacterium]